MTKTQPMTATEASEAAHRAVRQLAALAEGGDLDALRELAAVRVDLDSWTAFAVGTLRAAPLPVSWATIGRLLGTTRQAAHERFGP